MAIKNLTISKSGAYCESEPLKCSGGDVRVRVHKDGPCPVELLVSIDGEEEYLPCDDFAYDETKCEITIEGVMPGQYIKFRSRSNLLLIKTMEFS